MTGRLAELMPLPVTLTLGDTAIDVILTRSPSAAEHVPAVLVPPVAPPPTLEPPLLVTVPPLLLPPLPLSGGGVSGPHATITMHANEPSTIARIGKLQNEWNCLAGLTDAE